MSSIQYRKFLVTDDDSVLVNDYSYHTRMLPAMVKILMTVTAGRWRPSW